MRERAFALLRQQTDGGYVSWLPGTLELLIVSMKLRGSNLLDLISQTMHQHCVEPLMHRSPQLVRNRHRWPLIYSAASAHAPPPTMTTMMMTWELGARSRRRQGCRQTMKGWRRRRPRPNRICWQHPGMTTMTTTVARRRTPMGRRPAATSPTRTHWPSGRRTRRTSCHRLHCSDLPPPPPPPPPHHHHHHHHHHNHHHHHQARLIIIKPAPARKTKKQPATRLPTWRRSGVVSQSCGQAWVSGPHGRLLGKPWLPRKVTRFTAQCAAGQRTAAVRPGGLQWVPWGQQQQQVADGRWPTVDCAERQEHKNTCSCLPVTAQV